MGIDMSAYKVVYGNIVYNVVNVMPNFDKPMGDEKAKVPEYLDVWIIDEDSVLTLLRDQTRKFKFIRR